MGMVDINIRNYLTMRNLNKHMEIEPHLGDKINRR